MSTSADATLPNIAWFRNAAPYINAHRGRTFVICIGGEAAADPERLPALVHDLALLASLGVRLVLVHGARPQIEARLRAEGRELRYVNGLRVTDGPALEAVIAAAATVRVELEARLSMGAANTPMSGVRLNVSSGNHVIAKPLGVREGVDYLHTGEVRRIDTRSIRAQLELGQIVLLSPLGYSPTGEVFNLFATEIATATASALRADKLIFLEEMPTLRDASRAPLRQIGLPEARALLQNRRTLDEDIRAHLQGAVDACANGVRRVHLLERHIDGALLHELYTRDGIGMLISADGYESLRPATIDDASGILALIAPLEAEGILVRRSREQLELEIGCFSVRERDGMVIACAALYGYPAEGLGELACLAVAADYRHQGHGDELLEHIERRARAQGLHRLFVLTTRTAHWFRERGFAPGDLDELPLAKRSLYNYQRNSRIFFKDIRQ
ncbi:amino-acid N-acetyltransferase [Acidihalobacter ferrooxydans]|uniref:Amino-acid acetyltransferase n=1 Tax=Acidihalobacter ferrooxydans TaxID=1765967 RepID=A0A1P8UJG4_9GAMM|nr:amino-acid N-acetyltransferase [Acidihalobacter ferrooxydans]APZ43975.1 amino-acid N-acetyltransferase [Acidihalobacter ferrooxydans]